jgi:lipopolysaccharide export system permease protein
MYVPVSLLTVLVTLIMTWLTLFLAPQSISRSLSLRAAALQQGQFAPVVPGKFRTFGGSDVVVYAENVDPDGTLRNVFVERNRDGTVEVALAKRARHAVGRDGMTHTITLFDGERYEGVPGSPRFFIMHFDEGLIPVEVPKLSDTVTALEASPTLALIESAKKENRAELHWRIAMPVMCVVLTLLAVPLSRLRPREGRYARLLQAILIYFIYTTFLSAGKVWIARGRIPDVFGLWWVHAAVIGLAAAFILGPRWISRLRYREPATAVAAA